MTDKNAGSSLCAFKFRQIELQKAKKTEVENLDGNLQTITLKQHGLEKEAQTLRDQLAEKASAEKSPFFRVTAVMRHICLASSD